MQKFENWVPLESNSEVLNNYLAILGVNSEMIRFTDVLSFDSPPEGAIGALFVFPDSPKINNYFFDKGDQMFLNPINPDVYYMKQIAENACGTIAILHIIGNVIQEYPFILTEEGFAAQFIQETLTLNPEQRAEFLKDCKIEIKNEGGKVQSLQEAHKEVAQGEVPAEVEIKAGHHFIAFVWRDGVVYELDGRKKGPINYAQCEQHQFMEKVGQICIENYISQDDKQYGFNLMALQIGF